MPGYTVEKLLGRGGMGAVYRGVQMNLERPVAIKILPPGVEKEDPSFAERFKSEARLMAKLNHPAVVSVYDFGTTSAGQLYFAMEYVDGSDVSQMIRTQGRLPPEHALAITAHVCDALSAAHELGIVHRDIKPANVLLNMKGQVKVADFGLAKLEEPGQHGLTKTGYAMGTPDFVAPEALTLGTAIDGRADLYAVGVMLYQMLTGNIPRGAFKPAFVLVPGIDPRYDPIISKAMQHDREERHQNAADLRRELDVILTVPLVRNNAPESAAIPLAQVMQVASQRSAAQKPAAKGPQPRSNGGAAAMKSSAAKNPHATASPAKSKAPLFIGLGAVAAIAIGTIIMLSGKKPAGQRSSQQPLPNPPVAENRTKPTSSLPPPPPSGSAIQNSAYTWQDGSTTLLKIADQWTQRDGKFVALKSGTINFPKTLHDATIRLTMEHITGVNSPTLILRSEEGQTWQYGAHLTTDGKAQIVLHNNRDSQLNERLTEAPVMELTNGTEVTLEFRAQGDTFTFLVNDQVVASARNNRLQKGLVAVWMNEGRKFTRLEYAELPKSAPIPKAPPPPSAKSDLRSKPFPSPSTTPVSNFPPGQWVKLFTKAADLTDKMRESGVKFEDGWMTLSQAMPEVSSGTNTLHQNSAVRLRIKWDPDTNLLPRLHLRHDKIGPGLSRALRLGLQKSGSATLEKETADNNKPVKTRVGELIPRPLPEPGSEILLEFSVIGTRAFARMNEQIVSAPYDDQQNGPLLFYAGTAAVRDIEVINLDGLSNAEALNIIGVDEKGNDTRASRITQEKQAMEQAKVADAASTIPELNALHEQFVKLTAERVNAPFEADLAKLNTGYLGGIERKSAEEKAAGHLDGVIAFQAEKKLLADQQPIPIEDAGDMPPAIKTLRTIYRAAYAKINAARAANLKTLTDPFDLRLKHLESDLTRKNRIDDAKKVREYREALGKSTPGIQVTRASPTRGVASLSQNGLKSETALPPAAILAMKDGETNSLGMKFLPVKGTAVMFCIHEVRYQDYAAYAAEANGVYGAWKDQSGDAYTPTTNKEQHAVTRVSWEDARKFCAWLSQKEGKTYRLPTDEEWSLAVGLGHVEKKPKGTTPAMLSGKDKTHFPWGDDFPPEPRDKVGNYSDASRKANAPTGAAKYFEDYDDGFPTTAPVMSFKPNKLGLYDMGGNVWEWCEDWFDASEKDRVLRGSCWRDCGDTALLSSARYHGPPGYRSDFCGFRCVLELSITKAAGN